MKIDIQIPQKRFFIFFQAIIFGFFFVAPLQAQDSIVNILDLEQSYLSNDFEPAEELAILQMLSTDINDPNKILKYSDLLLEKATALDSAQYFFQANLQKGNAYRLKGDLSKALELYQIAANMAGKEKNDPGQAMANQSITNITIGDVHSEIGNHESSVFYYEKGILQLRQILNDSNEEFSEGDDFEYNNYLASALFNAGDEYFDVGNYEKALGYFYESSSLFNKNDNKLGAAYNLGSIGMVYSKQNKPELAIANLNEAIEILEILGDYPAISEYLIELSKIKLNDNQPDMALEYAQRSLNLSIKYELKGTISNANLQLSKIYEDMDNSEQSLFHLKEHMVYNDSISEVAQKVANQQTKFEVAKKQLELDLRVQRNKNERVVMYSFIGGTILVSFLALGLYRRNRFISKTKTIIESERKKADDLLLNILPTETAKELKEKGKVVAQKYESVTIVFTDFKDFTKYASKLAPEELVESVDMYFTAFDDIIKKHNLEKIKTIGDAYMFAGGIPIESDDHALKAVSAAHDILDFVNNVKKTYKVDMGRFAVRIGVHTGPVVAGVVGKNKFSYDIWGDSVNIAARLESNCEPGKINVSQSTFEAIKDHFSFEARGKISIKNRGEVDMYYVDKKPDS